MAGHDDDDPLTAAERQMAEHELASVSALLTKMVRRLDIDPEHPPTDEQVRAALLQLIEDDPEARELIETLGTFHAGRGED
jgi:hypothetical protein